jgi:hypothetical protein
LAVDVVLPVPFTPTIKIVVGRSALNGSLRLPLLSQALRALVIAVSISSLFDFFANSIISAAFLAPRSEVISACSNSSQSLLYAPPPRIFCKSLVKRAIAIH